MKRPVIYSVIILGLAAGCSIGAKNAKITDADRLTVPVNIDGQFGDWPALKMQDKATGVKYQVANDDQALYVAISVADRMLQKKVAMSGITFSIDLSGGKNYPITVTYPLKLSITEEQLKGLLPEKPRPDTSRTGQPFRPDRDFERQIVRSIQTQMNLRGFAPPVKSGRTDLKDTESGIELAMDWSEAGVLQWELKIPFSAIDNGSGVLVKDKEMAFRIVLHAMEMPDAGSGLLPGGGGGFPPPGGFNGPPPGGGGGFGGGGMQGPPPGGFPGGDMQEISKTMGEQTISFKLKLAAQ